MKCLILEPREQCREQLVRRLTRHADIACLGSFDAAGSPDPWHGLAPDVVFLGSDLLDLNTLLNERGAADQTAPVIVLLGDLPIHAMTAFDLQVTDFLLRPVDTIRLEECLRRVRERLQQKQDLARVAALSETLAEIRRGNTMTGTDRVYRDFWIRSRDETIRVPQSSIVWIEAARGYAYFNLHKRQLLHRISLLELEDRLDPAHFMRVHRSAIVNVHCIERTFTNRHGTIALGLTSGDKVRIGRKYRLRLAEYMSGKHAQLGVAA